jgi:hypothetical protein
MPNFTRLLAAILFAVAAIYAGEQYKLLYETPPRLGQMSLLLGVVGAYVGWRIIGGRIQGKLVADMFHGVQGFIAITMLALLVYGTLEVFELGYKMRYKTLPDAVMGFFDLTGAHVLRMVDMRFLPQVILGSMLVGAILSLLYRWAEWRRFK